MVDSTKRYTYVSHRSKPYIVGYSGYIPGMSFQYGHTFGRAAEDCVDSFARQLAQRQARKESEDQRRAKSLPRMRSAGPKLCTSQTNRLLSTDPYKRSNSPPIPGYTGYIPHMKSSEVGIGRTFSAAARKGYAQVARSRDRRQAHMDTSRSHRPIV